MPYKKTLIFCFALTAISVWSAWYAAKNNTVPASVAEEPAAPAGVTQ